ncbi:MBL fold metallo-hydrolase [bacterium]|nr:MBL fold metallo-hydrolase [bacterium]
MHIETCVAGPIQANNYLLTDEKSKEAVIIDCSAYLPKFLKYIKEHELTVKYILLTHGHFDHILGVNVMKKELNTKVYIHKNDLELARSMNEFMKIFGVPTDGFENPVIDGTLDELPKLSLGDNKIEILETPGHTKGSVSYKIENNLFCGDTMFRKSFGRTDLPGGSTEEITHSIKDILFNLDGSTSVYTGHGEFTTIGYEKQFNAIINC